ncbi:hypothetical protein ACWDSJ_32150 [Nocardia sp. NPDC003482]
MGTNDIDPQAIRTVTIAGDPGDTRRIVRRLVATGSGTAAALRWHEHTMHLTELSTRAPIAHVERAIPVADGLIVLAGAADADPRLETVLRVADDHQVARLCLVTDLAHPAADFGRALRVITAARGAVPVPVQIPVGVGPGFLGIVDLVTMWSRAPLESEFFGGRWELARRWYRGLVAAVSDAPEAGVPDDLPDRIRARTLVGEVVPVLCDAAPRSADLAALLDAVVRYLPSPMQVCQPEHVLDY